MIKPRNFIPGKIKAVTVWKSNTGGGMYTELGRKIIYFNLFYFLPFEIKSVEWIFWRK